MRKPSGWALAQHGNGRVYAADLTFFDILL
jgi:hypothetical protein